MFGPMLAQSKDFLDRSRVTSPQASLEPLSTISGVIITLPVASNPTVMFLVRATGMVLSTMVTTAVAVVELPL